MNSSCQEIPASKQFQLFHTLAPTTEETLGPHANGTQPQPAAHSKRTARGIKMLPRDAQLGFPFEPWTDEAILKLRSRLLQSLKRLNSMDDRRHKDMKEKRVWIAWVAAPFRAWCELAQTPEGPFSFQVCCLAVGSDPEATRDEILQKYAPAKAKFAELSDDCRMRTLYRQGVARQNQVRSHHE